MRIHKSDIVLKYFEFYVSIHFIFAAYDENNNALKNLYSL